MSSSKWYNTKRSYKCHCEPHRNITARRDTVQLNNRVRFVRRLRLRIYYFLDHPLNAKSIWYHFGVFSFVLLAVVLGATNSRNGTFLREVHFCMEVMLAIFFICEFCVRMWCISADAKYTTYKGRLRYFRRLVCIIDVLIIIVTIAIVCFEKTSISENTLDYLRFIQMFRLFHIDRQMTTWHLIKDMVMLSKWELLATYYVTFFLSLLMVNLIFISENEGLVLLLPQNTSEIQRSETFSTLAHAWWFAMITVPTIGYGDIVPSQCSSKIIVCFLGFFAYCTFVAASTQISVGLTLMMEEKSKQECKNKLRNIAASLIQFWYRYHLSSNNDRKMTEYFRLVCCKLYIIAKRMNRNRQLPSKLREKMKTKKRMRHLVDIIEQSSKQQLGTDVAHDMMQALQVDRLIVCEHHPYKESNIPTPFDISDIETHNDTDNIYDDDRFDSLDISDVEDGKYQKYRPLLQFFNFLLFRKCTKKFKRLREADRLLEYEAEIKEQEEIRQKELRNLEMRVDAMLGKPCTSLLNTNVDEKLSISHRLDLCEAKMTDMDLTMERIKLLVLDLSSLLGNNWYHDTTYHPKPLCYRGKRYEYLSLDEELLAQRDGNSVKE